MIQGVNSSLAQIAGMSSCGNTWATLNYEIHHRPAQTKRAFWYNILTSPAPGFEKDWLTRNSLVTDGGNVRALLFLPIVMLCS